ncbi:alpha/beta fold hydrolase [Sphingomonas glacialis]|nr:alpha/beta fold hydrolase [Sphingomonas glacialis]
MNIATSSRCVASTDVRVPLLLIPGTLCDERMFAPMLAALPHIDARVAPLCHDEIGAAALAILAEAPPHFALLGFSLGGMVALELAAIAPDRVVGLALVDSNARAVAPDLHAMRRTEAAQGASAHVARLWPDYVAPAAQHDANLRAKIEAMANAIGSDALKRQTALALSRRDSRSRLARLTMPALVLAGAHDALCPPAWQQELADGLPDSTLVLIADAGHFAPLERPIAVAAEVGAWLARLATPLEDTFVPHLPSTGDPMTDASKSPKPVDEPADDPRAVLQVERRDLTQLIPTDRPRVQSMRGFDPEYTDIVDYIVRCTHRIWDERDVGLIYTHYTHNCVVYGNLFTMYDRETLVRETISRLVELPDRRGMATSVIWRGNDVDGFYTSHMTHGVGRHTEFNQWGKPTGRPFVTRTIVDCMILENKIYREWVVRDNMALLIQLGIEPHAYAETWARAKLERGEAVPEIAESGRLLGQYPPQSEADVSIAHTPSEEQMLRWLHHIYTMRMFGKINEIYAPNCQWHGPLMRELSGRAAVLQQTMRLVAMIPDCEYVVQHICSNQSEEGGEKIAVRWTMEGHHFGYGSLGAPTGHKVSVMGFSHYHVVDGQIIDEWTVYDEFSMLVQLKMAAMQQAAA